MNRKGSAADGVVGREAAQGLEPAAVVVGGHEQLQVLSQIVMAVVMVALDGRILDRAVHPFDLTVIRHDGLSALTFR